MILTDDAEAVKLSVSTNQTLTKTFLKSNVYMIHLQILYIIAIYNVSFILLYLIGNAVSPITKKFLLLQKQKLIYTYRMCTIKQNKRYCTATLCT